MTYYIKREDAIKACNEKAWMRGEDIIGVRYPSSEEIRETIEQIPSADVVEHRRGKWIHESEVLHQERYRCSECGESFQCWVSMGEILPNYCSNCGADNRPKVEPKSKCHRHGIKTEDGTLIYECIGCDEMDCDMRGNDK